MSIQSQSSSAAYATKPNIAFPGTTAQAARVADKGETRITDDPSTLIPSASLAVATDRDAGVSETVTADPIA